MNQKNNFHPQFVERYAKILPGDALKDFLVSFTVPSPKAIRINTLKISVEDFEEKADDNHWKLTPVPWCEMGFYIDRPNTDIPLGSTSEHQAGLFYIQEAASMLPVSLLKDADAGLALDMTAAPGSKTSHLASYMNNTGAIVAIEPSKKRVFKITSNLVRLGIWNTHVLNKDSLSLPHLFPNTFDIVLADPPCSGEGYMRAKSELIKDWHISKVLESSKLQKKILEAAFKMAKKDGYFVYSTCTLAPEENEEVVDSLVQKYPDSFEIIDISKHLDIPGIEQCRGITTFENKAYSSEIKKSLRLWPHVLNCEGFYVCLMRKKEHIKEQHHPVQAYGKLESTEIVNKNEIKAVEAYIRKHFGYSCTIPKSALLIKDQHEYILRTKIPKTLQHAFKWFHQGLHIAKKIKDRFTLTHEAVLLWGAHFTTQVLELNADQYKTYIGGRDLEIKSNELQDGQVLVRYKGIPIGLGLLKGSKLKNQLPREYVAR